MAFFEYQFPVAVSAGMLSGPVFKTSKSYMAGGQRVSNRLTQYPLRLLTMSKPPQKPSHFEALLAFVMVVGGDADGFRVRDPVDYKATQENTSTTLVSSGVYQLNRIYVVGPRTFTRRIQKPVGDGISIFRTRSSVVTDITGTTVVDTTTGRITVTGHADGDTYNWSGRFDIPAAFRDPNFAFRMVGGISELTDWPSLEIEEIRV